MPEIACRASMLLLFLDSRQGNVGMTDGALDSCQGNAGMTNMKLGFGLVELMYFIQLF